MSTKVIEILCFFSITEAESTTIYLKVPTVHPEPDSVDDLDVPILNVCPNYKSDHVDLTTQKVKLIYFYKNKIDHIRLIYFFFECLSAITVHWRCEARATNRSRVGSRYFVSEIVCSKFDILRARAHHTNISIFKRIRTDGPSRLFGRTKRLATRMLEVRDPEQWLTTSVATCVSILLCHEFRSDRSLSVHSISFVANSFGRTASRSVRSVERTDTTVESISGSSAQFVTCRPITTRRLPILWRAALFRQDLHD